MPKKINLEKNGAATPPHANLIRAAKAIIDDGMNIKPTLSIQQVKTLCFALEMLNAQFHDDELRADFRNKIGCRGVPLSEETCHSMVGQLIRDVGGQVVYGPNYYKEG